MSSIFSDLKFGCRLLLKNPGFALVAILALALGIGANTAIFSAVDAVLLRPLPYGDPDRLVMVWEDTTFWGFPRNTPAPGNWVDWRKQNQVFTDMAALRGRTSSLTGDGPPEMVLGQGVTANLFPILGASPMLGRVFTVEEDRSGENVVVISYGLWQRRYGGDPSLVGRPILMDGGKVTVVGVMPRGFTTPGREADFWVPIHFTPRDLGNRGSHFLNVIARLKPGVSLAQARADMNTIARRLQQEYADTNRNVGAVVIPVKEQIVGNLRIALIVLLSAAGCVLLIACANIANLLLARAAGREREMAIRITLGAGRARLLRQVVTESVLLSLAGGAAGLVLARWSLGLLKHLVPVGMVSATLTIDGQVLIFTLGISLVTGVVFGLAPAWQSTRLTLNDALKQGGRTGVGGHRAFRDGLVVAEVALALMLLIGAGLMVQTLMRMRGVDPGFRPDHLLTMVTRLPHPKYADPQKRQAFYDAVLDKVKAMPGVKNAAFVSQLPFTSRGNTNAFRIEGRPPEQNMDALYRVGTNDYLQTIGVELKEGRLITSEDRAGSLPVVVINETFAKLYWPNESPIGKRIQIDDPRWITIVGVVQDVLERGIEPTRKPGVYLPVCQNPEAWAVPGQLVIRTETEPLSLAPAVRQAIWAVDREQPIALVRTMDDILDLEVADRRQQMILLGLFAGLALVLASIGIYGVLSYSVTQRTREIGLRMALGASSGDVTRMVVSQGLRLAVLGLAIGITGAFALTRLMTRLLFGVRPTDPATFAAVSGALLAISLFACYLPANRASRLDPMEALREE